VPHRTSIPLRVQSREKGKKKGGKRSPSIRVPPLLPPAEKGKKGEGNETFRPRNELRAHWGKGGGKGKGRKHKSSEFVTLPGLIPSTGKEKKRGGEKGKRGQLDATPGLTANRGKRGKRKKSEEAAGRRPGHRRLARSFSFHAKKRKKGERGKERGDPDVFQHRS